MRIASSPLPRSRSSSRFSQALHQVLAVRSRASPRTHLRVGHARSWRAPSRRRTAACRSRPSAPVLSSSALDLLDRVLQPARGQQVGLLDDSRRPTSSFHAGSAKRLSPLAGSTTGSTGWPIMRWVVTCHSFMYCCHSSICACSSRLGSASILAVKSMKVWVRCSGSAGCGAVGLVLLREVLQQLLAALGDVLEGVLHALGLLRRTGLARRPSRRWGRTGPTCVSPSRSLALQRFLRYFQRPGTIPSVVRSRLPAPS